MQKYTLQIKGENKFIILSPSVLYKLICKIKNNPSTEICLDMKCLFPKDLEEYLLNVLNANSDKDYFSFPSIRKGIFTSDDLLQLAQRQFTDLYIENDKCFEKVVLLNHTGNILELNCNKKFWIVCKSSEVEFFCSYPDGRTEILTIEI